MKELIWVIHKTLVAVITLFIVMAACVLAVVAIGYGEYMITSTGDIRWALFYVPHLIALVWYVRRSNKLGN